MADDNATSIYQKSQGHVQEVVSYTEFEAKGGVQYEAGAGVFVQVGQQEGIKEELSVIVDRLSESPSLAWMKAIRDAPSVNVHWDEVSFVMKEWDEEIASLTPEAAAVVAIAMAIATSGAGASLLGAGGTAAATATAAATTGASAAASATTLAFNAMANAAFTSLATTATLSM